MLSYKEFQTGPKAEKRASGVVNPSPVSALFNLGVPALPSLWFLILLITLFLHIKRKNLFLAALGFRCCVWAFSSCGERGLLSSSSARASHCGGVSCCGVQALSRCVGSAAAAPGFQSTGSAVAVHGICHVAFGIFLYQRSNPCVLHW